MGCIVGLIHIKECVPAAVCHPHQPLQSRRTKNSLVAPIPIITGRPPSHPALTVKHTMPTTETIPLQMCYDPWTKVLPSRNYLIIDQVCSAMPPPRKLSQEFFSTHTHTSLFGSLHLEVRGFGGCEPLTEEALFLGACPSASHPPSAQLQHVDSGGIRLRGDMSICRGQAWQAAAEPAAAFSRGACCLQRLTSPLPMSLWNGLSTSPHFMILAQENLISCRAAPGADLDRGVSVGPPEEERKEFGRGGGGARGGHCRGCSCATPRRSEGRSR